MIKAILHADKDWGIGRKNDLMFSLPKDMKFFRETTKGKTVVMGENTLRSFPQGKPLKNRLNIVLAQGDVGKGEDNRPMIVVATMEELKEEIRKRKEEEIFVIGGASMYQQLLPYCEEVLITKVNALGGAEVFFPNLDQDANFIKIYESEPEDDNGYQIRFTTYKNVKRQEI